MKSSEAKRMSILCNRSRIVEKCTDDFLSSDAKWNEYLVTVIETLVSELEAIRDENNE